MDWIAGIFELIGLWVVGKKSKWGFAFNIICGLLWIIHVITNRQSYGLLVVVIPALVINAKNFYSWKRDERLKDGKTLER